MYFEIDRIQRAIVDHDLQCLIEWINQFAALGEIESEFITGDAGPINSNSSAFSPW